MNHLGKFLLIAGGSIAAIGLLLTVGSSLGLGKLPGDLIWKKKGITLYFPLASSIVISVILTVVLNLWIRRK